MDAVKKLLLTLAFVLLNLQASGQVQLESELTPSWVSAPPLAGHAIFEIPAADLLVVCDVLPEPISFHIRVNSESVFFTSGRISGPHTAWVFDLGAPVHADGFTTFSGTTQMASFQIADMLANDAAFELVDEIGQSDYLSGSIAVVPEPSVTLLLAGGIFIMISAFRQQTRRHALV